MNKFNHWLSRDPDPITQAELQLLITNKNDDELHDRFKGRLVFGTAGLRGLVGCGPNRMNRLVIQETATGLGHYLIEHTPQAKERGVVVGYDGRTDSKQFAYDTAAILNALGIKVYLTYTVAPTPVVAFGIKKLNAAAAVVVTASHNPPEYNGFKVYWENGAQIIPPHDAGIAEKIEQATQQPLSLMSQEDAQNKKRLVWLKEDYYQDYQQTVINHDLFSSEIGLNPISIAYTAMHGVGAKLAEALLLDIGINNVYSVAEQREPDGAFPTVHFPNPEEPGAMDLVIEQAKTVDADLACANDPDADRFAVAARTKDGDYKMLTGDQVGILFADYLLDKTNAANALVGNSIVSSRLLAKIAHSKGATYFQTLTGFKWLANTAMQMEDNNKSFLFAYEEALGYAISDMVWDKDGLSAIVAFAQLANQLKMNSLSVWDQLENIYRQHGYYLNRQHSTQLDPNAPPIGDRLRANPVTEIAGIKVHAIEDLKNSIRQFTDGTHEYIDLPSSDVLVYLLEDGSRIIVRPSGTEPKLKCYYEVVSSFSKSTNYQQIQRQTEQKMADIIKKHQLSLC